MKPAFLITIDTEGDDLWSRPRSIDTRNAAYLPRFQQLCEKHGFRPTYLTNYEMAISKPFQEMARDCIARGTAEVGMHLHAWNSPPLEMLTNDDMAYQPYLIEYPTQLMRQKIECMTHLLEDTFQTDMVSHRAGRWAIDSRYVQLLVEYGYTVDCSVTPTVSWKTSMGHPEGAGGTDYREYPADAYFVDLDDPARVGSSTLLELPMTVRWPAQAWAKWVPSPLTALPGMRRLAKRQWLRPSRTNIAEMLALVESERHLSAPYLEFMLHSSEFMPGGSRVFRNEQEIEVLYSDLDRLFACAAEVCCGRTLKEYGQEVLAGQRPAARAG